MLRMLSIGLLAACDALHMSAVPPNGLQQSRRTAAAVSKHGTLQVRDTKPSTAITGKQTSSNISLLDHVNFNVPDHSYILDFYLDLLGCGLDPKVACNLMDNDQQFGREGLIWASCGPNQIHLPRCFKPGETAQVLSGHIGLRYKSLEGLRERLARAEKTTSRCFESCRIVQGRNGETVIQIQDCYGNVFHCREGPEKQRQYQQLVVKINDQDKFADVALRYGVAEASECRGIDYVEFNCESERAERIALFYETFFDATAFVREDDGRQAAYIAVGDINASGEAAQYLVFRETTSEVPAYDGHHIAIYIGTTDVEDFERAFLKAERNGLLSTNWRDKVDVLDLEAARSQSQFRIRDLRDVETDDIIFQLDHEIRSMNHPTWPGRARQQKSQ